MANRKRFMPDEFYLPEERSGFYVDELRKKVWAVELEILAEFDRVCKKYNLKYFADYGTLLGAVRHGGFIPWDDDIDISIHRDDYKKLCEVAEDEFKEPFFFQNTYNCLAVTCFAKIRDSRTTAIEPEHLDWGADQHQGIFIDICPMDDAPDGTPEVEFDNNMRLMLWQILANPDMVIQMVDSNDISGISPEFVRNLAGLSMTDRYRTFEKYCEGHNGKSKRINYIASQMYNRSPSRLREWFEDTVFLPFENIEIPCPVGYEEILRMQYGDYEKPVMGSSVHTFSVLDPDNPYTKYVK